MVDDDNAVAKSGDIGHIMAGEQDGCAGTTIIFLKKGADPGLGGDIESDGRLIQEEYPWDGGAILRPARISCAHREKGSGRVIS